MDFNASYDAVLAKWPSPVVPVDVDTPFGTTHVNVSGPASAPPLVLLHGGGATSTVWFAMVQNRRIFAIDQINDSGRSVPSPSRPIRTRDDLTTWLDSVLTGLGLETAALGGHSYGGWLALNYALDFPERISHLALLDPSMCFAGMRLSYRLRAIPIFLPGRRASRLRTFLRWETGGAALDPDWLEVTCAGADLPRSPIVLPTMPAPQRLQAFLRPTLVLVAAKSRSHNPARVAANARTRLPNAVVEMLPGATHHTIPTLGAADINAHLERFLT